MPDPTPRIFQASSAVEIAAARAILLEYRDSLDVDLCFQNFATELAGLPGEYSPPAGRLFLAEVENELAGCAALRPRSPEICEMKRLFVRPSYRGRKLGHLLATTIIAEAQAIGYREMQLDSLPSMREARRLYTALGFLACAPYYDSPIAGTVFMSRPLVPRARS